MSWRVSPRTFFKLSGPGRRWPREQNVSLSPTNLSNRCLRDLRITAVDSSCPGIEEACCSMPALLFPVFGGNPVHAEASESHRRRPPRRPIVVLSGLPTSTSPNRATPLAAPAARLPGRRRLGPPLDATMPRLFPGESVSAHRHAHQSNFDWGGGRMTNLSPNAWRSLTAVFVVLRSSSRPCMTSASIFGSVFALASVAEQTARRSGCGKKTRQKI